MVTRRSGLFNRISAGDKVFDIVNVIFMSLFMLIMLYPLYYTIIASLSDITQVGLGNVYLLPKGFSLDAYIQIFNHPAIWTGYKNSILYAVLYVLYNLAIMLPVAYILSKKQLFGRNVLTTYFLITMYFGGGMVPSYLLITQTLKINNTVWVMVLGALSVYNMVVTRIFFTTSIPDELYESAEMDGANQFSRFFRIALPLSTPIIAVQALFFTVYSWNSYFGALLYINKSDMYPLQLVLRSILIMNERLNANPELLAQLSPEQLADIEIRTRLAESMKYSTIFIGSAPLLIAYPFVQKYFVKGMLIGSLKG